MAPNERIIKAKENLARFRRGGEEREVFEDSQDPRLPPGQHEVQNWPVLDIGCKPDIALADWTLTVGGLVTSPLVWTWEQYLAEATFTSVSDLHCVTSWSIFENHWEGVSFKRLLEVVKPLPEAKFVLFTAYDDYTTNLPLSACNDDDVVLVYRWNGKLLTRDHGRPVRMIVPKRYGWKGAKWIKEIAFSETDQKGFWEVRGYSNSGFPWQNDRYG
jgi:DMSO/TMAO reductase YedYZ molybdopterin-dependent catalytic subunit